MAAPAPLAAAVLLVTAAAVARAAGLGIGVLERPADGPAAVVETPVPAAAVPLVVLLPPPGAPPSPRPGRPDTRASGTSTVAPAHGWLWPLAGTPAVVQRFAIGPHPWSPGHRGVDLASSAGAEVLAPGDGVVSFAGPLAGRGVLVIVHAGGIRTTYEPVTPTVRVGDPVSAGQVVGHLQGSPSHCAPLVCLHWGALVGTRYVDPLALLAKRDPPILLPLGGLR